MVSDAEVARQILLTNAGNYSKGLLSEILDFVMGTGAPRAVLVVFSLYPNLQSGAQLRCGSLQGSFRRMGRYGSRAGGQ